MESLEPRLLLSAAPWEVSASGGAVSLSLEDDAGTPTFFLRDGDGATADPSSTLADTSSIQITGTVGNDELTIDLTSQAPGTSFQTDVHFDGGDGNDSLILLGPNAQEVHHTFDNASDGTVEIDFGGGVGVTVTYEGLEPVADNLVAVDRVFTFSGMDDVVSLGDDSGAQAGVSTIESAGTSESVDFANPTGSLTVETGDGDDSVQIQPFEAGFDFTNVAVSVDGGAGDDSVSVTPGNLVPAVDVVGGGGIDEVVVDAAGNALGAPGAGTVRVGTFRDVTFDGNVERTKVVNSDLSGFGSTDGAQIHSGLGLLSSYGENLDQLQSIPDELREFLAIEVPLALVDNGSGPETVRFGDLADINQVVAGLRSHLGNSNLSRTDFENRLKQAFTAGTT